LAERAFSLPGVHEQPSAISVPGARALVLQGDGDGPASAFLTGREFAHLHPDPDWSLHLTLAEDLARNAIGAGWAEPHFLAQTGALPPTVVLVYAPRDRTELDVVWHLLQESQRFATGALDAPAQREPQP
jgi:phospholipase/carboxylesterase